MTELIGISELMKRLQVSRQTIHKYCKKGLPFLRAPGQKTVKYFDWVAVIEWLKEGGKK